MRAATNMAVVPFYKLTATLIGMNCGPKIVVFSRNYKNPETAP